jgi:AAA domain
MSRPRGRRGHPSIRDNSARRGPHDGPRTFTAATLQQMEFPPVQYAVEGFVAEGLTLLAGKPKIGKSWMALEFAIAVSSGGNALGEIKCDRGTVLYCALEDNPRRLQRRMHKLCGHKGSWPESLHLTTTMARLEDGGLEWLEDWIISNEPTLVIIDTLAAVRTKSGAEHSYEADYAALTPLQKLAGNLEVSIIVVHYLRKMKGDDPLDAISGTTGLTGAVDTALVLGRGSHGATLYGRGREVEEVDVAVEFIDGKWKFLGETAKAHRSEEREAILNALQEADEALGPNAIATALGKPVNNIKQLLLKMVSAGEIQKHGRGKYVVPAT